METLNYKETSALLRVSRSTVEQYVRAGKLHPTVIHSRKQRRGFDREEVGGLYRWRCQHNPEMSLLELAAMRRAGLSQSQIAKATGIAPGSVGGALRRAGVETLSAWERAGAPAGLTYEQEQMVIGTMLGDGHIQGANPKHQNYVGEHSTKQRAYLLHKYEVLKAFCHMTPTERTREFPSVRFITMAHPVFATIRRQMVDEKGNRALTPSLLDRIGPMALAYWYMDDGSLHKNQYGTQTAMIYSYKLGEEQNRIAIAWLGSRWGIEAALSQNRTKRPGRQHSIRIRSNQPTKQFLRLIEPYILLSLQYKLGV